MLFVVVNVKLRLLRLLLNLNTAWERGGERFLHQMR